jgi:PrtD family type I secretion system ABC transporter
MQISTKQEARTSGAASRSELTEALASCRGAFISTALFSGMSNILMLTGAIFMLEVYDRVLPSRSIPTLLGISALAIGLYAALGLLDLIRGRLLVRVGSSLDYTISPRVYDALVGLPLKAGNRGDGLQSLRDLDSVRSFLSGAGPIALFDLPWMPLYLAICFGFHYLIGITALVGAIVLCGLTILTEIFTREPGRRMVSLGQSRNNLAEASRRNAEALVAMGMAGRIAARWHEANREYIESHRQASDIASSFSSTSKVLRMILQSAVLAVGAYLVINQEATAGIIIAGSILSARALAPVDMAIANWKNFVAARQSWGRLNQLLAVFPPVALPMQLELPRKTISVESVSVVPPGDKRLVVSDVTFSLKAGDGLGIIGPSGSGKSCLARLLVGVWTPARGRVRLDGATSDQWSADLLGAHVGYLPQDVELMEGTIAQNISRFAARPSPEAVVAAAKNAGVHEMILNFPEGYDTQIGDQGTRLSAGQAQRIALARALYGDPFLIVLDEPNSNLDAEGDEALSRAIHGIRARNGIVIVVAHRQSAISGVGFILAMNKGRLVEFGPKEEILNRVLKPQALRAVEIVR